MPLHFGSITDDSQNSELLASLLQEVKSYDIGLDARAVITQGGCRMLYARKDKDDNSKRRQTLAEHCRQVANDTAYACRWAGMENLGWLLGLIHDAPKSYRVWQNYFEYGGPTVFHAPYAVEFFLRAFGHIKAPYAELTRQMLNIASWSHHGWLHDALTPSGEKVLPTPSGYTAEETAEADEAFFAEAASREELERAFVLACGEVERLLTRAIGVAAEPKALTSENGTRSNEAMMYMGLSQRLLYSALIDADRMDAACWEAREMPPEKALPDWERMLKSLEARLSEFDGKGIGKLRGHISYKCASFDAESGVYRLFVPTGGGNTLSSLRLALTVAKKYGKRRIVYAEPFLTILSQTAREIRKAVGEDPDDRDADSDVLEFHSNVSFEEDERGEEQENQYLKLSERLDKPIVVTSNVQLLNSLFSGKSACARRMSALVNSVIVVDEVQAVPSGSTYLFSMAMNYLARFCNCLAILCTATPPALENIAYPVRLSPNPDVVGDISELFAAFKRTKIKMVPGKMASASDVCGFVIDRLQENQNCLVIMNTKAAARKLFELAAAAVKGEYDVFYLSTSLCPANREDILGKIQKLLPHGRVLVISTQLIEAGVDISFECVVRSLAGLDSIIQAAGRCNRNGDDGIGSVYVLDCDEENLNMLPDIARGKSITATLAAANIGADMASPEMVRRYYEQYFLDKRAGLDYKLDEGRTAVNLLGNNFAARKEYASVYRENYPLDLLAQSFQTVGRAYKPIEDNTTGVVVPYGNSAALLAKLKLSRGRERTRCLRALQRYCVNVYDNQLRALEQSGAITFDEDIGVWTLEPDAYSKATGIEVNYQADVDKYIS